MDGTSVLDVNRPLGFACTVLAVLLSLLILASANGAEQCGCAAVLEVSPRAEKILLTKGHFIEKSNFKVQIRNTGESTLVLIKPGDGSESGLRTPTVQWSVLDSQGRDLQDVGMRIDDVIKPLQANEIFSLKPGDSFDLSEWMPPIAISTPGTYKVLLRYVNDPSTAWAPTLQSPRWWERRMPTHDKATMRAVRQSTKCEVVSDAVGIEISTEGNN